MNVFGDSCNSQTCGKTITMPVLDNQGAYLKADLDVSAMNKHLTAYIQQEIQKGVETAMKQLMEQIIDKELEDANKTIMSTAESIFQSKLLTFMYSFL